MQSIVNQFQNCVILDSDKTDRDREKYEARFQNCVILDSDKTIFTR